MRAGIVRRERSAAPGTSTDGWDVEAGGPPQEEGGSEDDAGASLLLNAASDKELWPLSSIAAMRSAPRQLHAVAGAVDRAAVVAARFFARQPLSRVGLLLYLSLLHIMVLWLRASCHSQVLAAVASGAEGGHLPGSGSQLSSHAAVAVQEAIDAATAARGAAAGVMAVDAAAALQPQAAAGMLL